MSVEQMRGEIALVYSGDKWKSRVARMSENQVMAVYYRLSQTGKLEEALSGKTPPKTCRAVRYEQMRMDI